MPQICTNSISNSWDKCWEDILRLPLESLLGADLFKEAKRIVKFCRSSVGRDGIDWFEWQVRDGLLFVAEALVTNPDDPEWQRIEATLVGAEAGLRDD